MEREHTSDSRKAAHLTIKIIEKMQSKNRFSGKHNEQENDLWHREEFLIFHRWWRAASGLSHASARVMHARWWMDVNDYSVRARETSINSPISH
jgi:hypothetical protein